MGAVRKALRDARAVHADPLPIDFLKTAVAVLWGIVLALMVGGLLS